MVIVQLFYLGNGVNGFVDGNLLNVYIGCIGKCPAKQIIVSGNPQDFTFRKKMSFQLQGKNNSIQLCTLLYTFMTRGWRIPLHWRVAYFF